MRQQGGLLEWGYIIGIIVGLYLKHGEGRGTVGFPQEMGMIGA
jgi:hypothetical protein